MALAVSAQGSIPAALEEGGPTLICEFRRQVIKLWPPLYRN